MVSFQPLVSNAIAQLGQRESRPDLSNGLYHFLLSPMSLIHRIKVKKSACLGVLFATDTERSYLDSATCQADD